MECHSVAPLVVAAGPSNRKGAADCGVLWSEACRAGPRSDNLTRIVLVKQRRIAPPLAHALRRDGAHTGWSHDRRRHRLVDCGSNLSFVRTKLGAFATPVFTRARGALSALYITHGVARCPLGEVATAQLSERGGCLYGVARDFLSSKLAGSAATR